MKRLLLLLIACAAAAAQTSLEFEAVWKKKFRPDRNGVLRIGDSGLTFQTDGKDGRERAWPYADIQHFDRLSGSEIEIRSYEDSAWRLGLDRRYRFVLKDGELGDDIHREIVRLVGKPATNRVVVEPADAELEIPVKHLRQRGSSHGTLFFAAERIVYSSAEPKRSREWMLDRDVDAVWSSDPYRLEVHAFDGRDGYLRQPTTYKFALKRPLDRDFYQRLKMKLYDLERKRSSLR